MANEKTGESRRDFLKMSVAAAPAAAVAAVAAPKGAEAASDVGRDELIRDTEHTRKYFASARF